MIRKIVEIAVIVVGSMLSLRAISCLLSDFFTRIGWPDK
jgi:hypothetical protein